MKGLGMDWVRMLYGLSKGGRCWVQKLRRYVLHGLCDWETAVENGAGTWTNRNHCLILEGFSSVVSQRCLSRE